jgi:Tfp pilus assembly protein PilF
MSTTLDLVDRLLARGRHFQLLGRDNDVLHFLGKLAGFGELPAAVAEETQARLAEINLRCKRPRKARRHLTAALAHQPDNARYHYLMGRAVEADRRGDPERALEHYRRSLELDADQAACASECGLLAVRQGQSEEGLRNLRRAVELDENDPEHLRRLAKGLCLLRRQD